MKLYNYFLMTCSFLGLASSAALGLNLADCEEFLKSEKTLSSSLETSQFANCLEYYPQLNLAHKSSLLKIFGTYFERYNTLPDEQKEIFADQIINLMNKVISNFSLPQAKPVVLLLGGTGSGKTTALAFLKGADLVVKRDHLGEPFIENPVLAKGLEFCKGLDSCTLFPSFHEINGTVYVDCPGFGDNRGLVHQIINAFLIRKIVEESKQLKIVLTVEEQSLRDRQNLDNLRNALENLENYAPNFDKYKEGMMLLITKGSSERDSQKDATFFSEQVQLLLQQSSISGYAKKFLSFVEKKGNFSFSFRKVDKSLVGSNIKDNKNIRENILTTINKKIQFSTVGEDKELGIKLSSEAQLRILSLANQIMKAIKKNFEEFYADLYQYFEKEVSLSFTGEDKVKNFIESLSNAYLQVKAKINTAQDLQSIIIDQLNKLNIKVTRVHLDKIISHTTLLSLLKKIGEDDLVFFEKHLYQEGIEQIQKTLPTLLSETKIEEGVFVAKGHTLWLSQIMKRINEAPTPLSKINIYALQRVIFDSSLESFRINGAELSIMTLMLELIGHQKIVLDGMPGPKHPIQQASSEEEEGGKGLDGLPGAPGGNAGSFLGLFEKILIKFTDSDLSSSCSSQQAHNQKDCSSSKGFASLSVVLNGGKGGPGQHGGNGNNGKDGEKLRLNYKELLPRDSASVKQISINSGYIIDTITYEVAGEAGQKGGDGGRGGKGGYGGLGGSFKIINITSYDPSYLNVTSVNGTQGDDGQAGLSGRGGRSSPNVRGVYQKCLNIKEWIKDHNVIWPTVAVGLAAGTSLTTYYVLNTKQPAPDKLYVKIATAGAGIGVFIVVPSVVVPLVDETIGARMSGWDASAYYASTFTSMIGGIVSAYLSSSWLSKNQGQLSKPISQGLAVLVGLFAWRGIQWIGDLVTKSLISPDYFGGGEQAPSGKVLSEKNQEGIKEPVSQPFQETVYLNKYLDFLGTTVDYPILWKEIEPFCTEICSKTKVHHKLCKTKEEVKKKDKVKGKTL